MPNLPADEGRARFEKIATALAAADPDHSITFGLAEAEPSDSPQELIARADADLLEARQARTGNDVPASTRSTPVLSTKGGERLRARGLGLVLELLRLDRQQGLDQPGCEMV